MAHRERSGTDGTRLPVVQVGVGKEEGGFRRESLADMDSLPDEALAHLRTVQHFRTALQHRTPADDVGPQTDGGFAATVQVAVLHARCSVDDG